MIRAYPGSPSVYAGEDLILHVSSTEESFIVRIFRCGATLQPLALNLARMRGMNVPAGAAEMPWQWPEYHIEIPAAARPGVYVAILDDGDRCDARSARALFVVRPRRVEVPLLVVLPLFTYHAYNVAHVDGTRGEGEGECLYSGHRWVTLQRPGGGTGGHPWDEVNADVYDPATPRQTFAHWDQKALAWIEARGYGYDCCTDLEIHEGTVDVKNYAAVASFGHHEYWTDEMRSRIEAFVENGGCVAFFGGNTCWFRAEYDAQRHAVRRAGRWDRRPESAMTGVSYACGGGKWIGARPATGYRIANPGHWIYSGLNAETGMPFGFAERLIGYECDGAPSQSDLVELARASLTHWPVADGSGEVSTDAHASLGVRGPHENVFTASTVDWARVLAMGERCVNAITANVLNRYCLR